MTVLRNDVEKLYNQLLKLYENDSYVGIARGNINNEIIVKYGQRGSYKTITIEVYENDFVIYCMHNHEIFPYESNISRYMLFAKIVKELSRILTLINLDYCIE